MVSLLLNIIKISFLLGFLIFIHELGHFLMAKAFKVKIKEFAIGFGPTLWKKTGKTGTNYALRLIPLGGFVNMLGEEIRSDEEGSYYKLSKIKKILILLAGPIVNIIFGFVTYFIIISFVGTYVTTTIENVVPGYAAEQYGLQAGDKIVKINGKNIKYKSQIDQMLGEFTGGNLEILIERNGQKQTINLIPTKLTTKSIGIYLGVEGEDLSTEIKSIYDNSPAEQIGLQKGDIITHVNGIQVENVYHLVNLIQTAQTETIDLTFIRNNKTEIVNTKANQTDEYYLGIYAKKAEDTFGNKMYYAFWNTIDFSTSFIDSLKEMFSGKVEKDQFMGPVGISTIVVKTKQIEDYFYILAVISVSLGVTNLLPIPPLDGGKILLILLEVIRRKPLKENTELSIQLIGMTLFMLLAIIVAYNDVLRIF